MFSILMNSSGLCPCVRQNDGVFFVYRRTPVRPATSSWTLQSSSPCPPPRLSPLGFCTWYTERLFPLSFPHMIRWPRFCLLLAFLVFSTVLLQITVPCSGPRSFRRSCASPRLLAGLASCSPCDPGSSCIRSPPPPTVSSETSGLAHAAMTRAQLYKPCIIFSRDLPQTIEMIVFLRHPPLSGKPGSKFS